MVLDLLSCHEIHVRRLTGIGWKPPIEEIKTMDPAPLFFMCGKTDFASKKEAFTLVSKILSQASSEHYKNENTR